MSIVRVLAVFSLCTLILSAFSACEPAALPEDLPGPAGCGMKDPRDTAPGMLSLAQKMVLKKKGKPTAVEKNAVGGLDWVYSLKSGGVFGEEETVTKVSFDGGGVHKGTLRDLISKVGK